MSKCYQIKVAEHDYQESKDLLCQQIDTCYNKNFNVLGWVLKVETMQYHDFRNSNWNYHLICKYMTDPSSGDHFHRFVELWKHKSMKNQKYISWSDERAWNYQKCHEFGWFKTHSGIRTLKSAIEDSCDQFSDKFEENVINLQARVSAQFANDSSFFSDACLSNNLCDRYLSYRPVPDCQKYVTPKQGI